MFGISFGKVVLLVAVVAVIWFGFRWFQRWEKERRDRAEREEREEGRLGRDASPRPRGDTMPTEVMTACRVCGTYVAEGTRSCGRPRCPFPT